VTKYIAYTVLNLNNIREQAKSKNDK
jgi:hypothetical protein